MNNINDLLNLILKDGIVRLIIYRPFKKEGYNKIIIRPVRIKDRIMLQAEKFTNTQVFHDNINMSDSIKILSSYMKDFKQLDAQCKSFDYTIYGNKHGEFTVKKKQKNSDSNTKLNLEHNKTKRYILNEGRKIDFLVELGVMTSDSKITKSKYDKFRQINRYLEFVDDIMDYIASEDVIRIVDFGCGKSYLTFALYYYLKNLKKQNVEIIGLDLKKDVISDCNALRDKLGYDGLRFLYGDIKDYEDTDRIDMVVSLHACDTATDYAISKAVNWNSKVIMAVPCCQHEVNSQIDCKDLSPILKYGIIKEKMSALITDAYRALSLENAGYKTQILEFIDIENTPKNLLIRAVKSSKTANNPIHNLEEYFNIKPTIGTLL